MSTGDYCQVALSEGFLFIYFLNAFHFRTLMSATVVIIIFDHKALIKLCWLKLRRIRVISLQCCRMTFAFDVLKKRDTKCHRESSAVRVCERSGYASYLVILLLLVCLFRLSISSGGSHPAAASPTRGPRL